MVATDHNTCYSLFRSTSTHSVLHKWGSKKYDFGHSFSNIISTFVCRQGTVSSRSNLGSNAVSTFDVHLLTR